MGGSRASDAWASVLRSGLRLSLTQRGTSSGWRVSDLRGRTRLTVDTGGGRHQVLLPIEWAHDQADAIRETVLAIHAAHSDGLTLDRAIAAVLISDQPATDLDAGPIDWPSLVERFKSRKLSSGAIKPRTWEAVYRRQQDTALQSPGTAGSHHCAVV